VLKPETANAFSHIHELRRTHKQERIRTHSHKYTSSKEAGCEEAAHDKYVLSYTQTHICTHTHTHTYAHTHTHKDTYTHKL